MPSTVSPELLIDEFLGVHGFDINTAAIQKHMLVSPSLVDDRTRLYGMDVYEKMLLDEDVSSAVDTRCLMACAEGVHLQVAEGADKNNPNDIKNIYLAFVKRSFAAVGSMKLLSLALLAGLSFGSKIAEVNYKYGMGEDAGRIVLGSIKPKSSRFWNYVVADNGDLLGVAPHGWLTPERQAELNKAAAAEGVTVAMSGMVPRDKFLYFVNRPVDGRVTGSSILNAAYTPWYIKTQVIPDFFKFLTKFATPSIVGKLPKPSDDPSLLVQNEESKDENGNTVTKSKMSVLKEELLKFVNAYVLVVKGGSEIDLLKSEGNGEAFQFAMKYFGGQITKAILGTSQATTEAQHESRSSKDVAQDIIGLRTMADREALSETFTWLARTLIRINFGEAALIHAPVAVLTQIEQQDRFKALDSMSNAYAKGFIKDPQLDAVHIELGLPPMPEGWMEEERLQREQAATDRSRLSDPQTP